MKNEIYHTLNIVKCECSVNSIDYDATDLIIKNVYAYRVTLEHFRITEVIDGLTTQSQPLYEVENSSYLSEVMASGMKALYGSSLNVKHYVISTTEHIVDILTSESYIIE